MTFHISYIIYHISSAISNQQSGIVEMNPISRCSSCVFFPHGHLHDPWIMSMVTAFHSFHPIALQFVPCHPIPSFYHPHPSIYAAHQIFSISPYLMSWHIISCNSRVHVSSRGMTCCIRIISYISKCTE